MDKIILLFVLLMASSCGADRVGYTIFLKEHESRLENLKGDECLESGYQIYKEGKELIIFYTNCEIHSYRTLDQFDPAKSGLPLQPKTGDK